MSFPAKWTSLIRLGLLAVLLAILSGCFRDSPTSPTSSFEIVPPLRLTPQSLVIDGSALMQPFAAALAAAFQQNSPDVPVVVGESGTRTGFARFCVGEFSLMNALRPIIRDEVAVCESHGVAPQGIVLAHQAAAVVVSAENTFAGCLNSAQVASIWRAGGTIRSWAQVNLQYPDLLLAIYAPSPDTLVYNLFQEQILDGGTLRHEIYGGLPVGADAIGFLDLSEALRLAGSLRLLPLARGTNSEAECVTPSETAVLNGSYPCLARPLLLYVDTNTLSRPEIARYLRFVLSDEADPAIRQFDLIPPTLEDRTQALQRLGL